MVATMWMMVMLATIITYVRMLMLLATSMVMMKVPVVTIWNGNKVYCSSEENADRDTMVVALMVRKTMMAVLMVINIVIIMMDVHSDYVRTYV